MGYYPLSHRSTPTKEATSTKKRNLFGQIALQEQHYHNKNPKIGSKMATYIHTRSRPRHKSPQHIESLKFFHVYEQSGRFWPMSTIYTFIKRNKTHINN